LKYAAGAVFTPDAAAARLFGSDGEKKS